MQSQAQFITLYEHMREVIVGQQRLLDRLLISLLTGRHLLLESPPGLAKTTAVKALASGIHARFQRIQFTPDLLPGDLTGSEVFDPKDAAFHFVQGPLFHEIILADEINRAPPKVQSALLEAMEEHQITVGGKTHRLPELFLVLATQNPLEQSGTYPLPEAQLDRFLMQVNIDYPTVAEELEILRRDRQAHFADSARTVTSPLSPELVLKARDEVAQVHMDPSLERYVVDIVAATRNLEAVVPQWAGFVEIGASPRATLSLVRAGCAHAYLQGRDYLMPEDILEVATDVLRHRIIPSFKAHAAQVDSQTMIGRLLEQIPVP